MNLTRIELAGLILASVTLATEGNLNAVLRLTARLLPGTKVPLRSQEQIKCLCLITSLLRV